MMLGLAGLALTGQRAAPAQGGTFTVGTASDGVVVTWAGEIDFALSSVDGGVQVTWAGGIMADIIYRNLTTSGALTLVENVSSPHTIAGDPGQEFEVWVSRAARTGAVFIQPEGVAGEGFVPSFAPTGLNAYGLAYSDTINSEVLPITATYDGFGNGRRLTLGSFQPIQFRNRFRVETGGANSCGIPNSEITRAGSWREGLMDGGTAMFWRVVNGSMTLIRTSEIIKYRASGWNGLHSGIVPTGTTTFTLNYEPWRRPGVTQWFTVRAVGANGGWSAPATAATHTVPDPIGAGPVAPSNTTTAKTLTSVQNGAISAPANLTATPSNGGMTVTLSWDAVSGVDGYAVFMSDYDPANHLGFGLDLAEDDAPILAGDWVFVYKELREFNKPAMISNRIWNTGEISFFLHENIRRTDVWGEIQNLPGQPSYVLLDHDPATNIPGKGKTFARITVGAGQSAAIQRATHGGKDQTNDFYMVLDPDKTYRVEAWIKADASRTATFRPDLRAANGSAQSPSGNVPWNVTTSWQKFTHEFSPLVAQDVTSNIGAMSVLLPEGVWDVDSVFIFETGTPHLAATPQMVERAQGLGALRFHHHTKTQYRTYDLDQLTNFPGYWTRETLFGSLQQCVDCGVDPWMQPEMHLTPDEWDGLLEYLAGTTGTWAAKRASHGRTAPWVNSFDRVYIEVSNERWNINIMFPWSDFPMTDSVTGTVYGSGEVYGLWQEWLIARWQAHPLWTPELAAKIKFVLGGWGLGNVNGWTTGAVDRSPNSDYITIAAYNGGWEAGQGAPVPGLPNSYRYTMTYTMQGAGLAIDALNASADGMATGTYEAGPGYVLNGLNGVVVTALEDQNQERVMKSKAGGVATIDVFLRSAEEGMSIQNYFTLSEGYRWTSHAADYRGGKTFPGWQFVQLFNEHCGGLDMIGVQPAYGPRSDLAAVVNPSNSATVYPALDDADDVAMYAFRDDSKLCLWAISRKLPWDELPTDDPLYDADDDGVTTAWVRLPISAATSVKRYRMTGRYDQHNVNPEAFMPWRRLSYDGGTAAFTAGTVSAGPVHAVVTGALVTGATSGATGQVWRVNGTTASGSLDLTGIVGTFQDNEALQVSGETRAFVNGTIGSVTTSIILGLADPLYADLTITEETLSPPSVQNFTLPGGIPPASADLYVFEGITPLTISGAPSFGAVTITPTTADAGDTLTASVADVTGYPEPVTTWEWRNENEVIPNATSSTFVAPIRPEDTIITARPIIANRVGSATLTEAQMLSISLGLTAGRSVVTGREPEGIWEDLDGVVPEVFYDLTFANMAANADGTGAITAAGQDIRWARDLSPHGRHAAFVTSQYAQPHVSAVTPERIGDRSGAELQITVPAGGWTGTVFAATTRGMLPYKATIPAGATRILGDSNFSGWWKNLVGLVVIQGDLTTEQIDLLRAHFAARGASTSLADSGSLEYWRGNKWITEIPSGYSYMGFLANVFGNASFGNECPALTTIPVGYLANSNMFGDIYNLNGGVALSPASVSNILNDVSAKANSLNLNNKTLTFASGRNYTSAGAAALANLISRGWTVTIGSEV